MKKMSIYSCLLVIIIFKKNEAKTTGNLNHQQLNKKYDTQ